MFVCYVLQYVVGSAHVLPQFAKSVATCHVVTCCNCLPISSRDSSLGVIVYICIYICIERER